MSKFDEVKKELDKMVKERDSVCAKYANIDEGKALFEMDISKKMLIKVFNNCGYIRHYDMADGVERFSHFKIEEAIKLKDFLKDVFE